jgi:hypothetical protein
MGFNNQVFSQGATLLVQTQSLWLWDTTTNPSMPTVSGYPVGLSPTYPSGYAPTKTGLQPSDLQGFVGVPLVYYGNPSIQVDNATIQGWIRQAEDSVEQQTSILLCQTWVASPPAQTAQIAEACGLLVNTDAGFQIRGYDYDLEDAGYDFQFPRAQDEGWLYYTLRYRPVQSTTYGVTGSGATPATQGITAVKNTSFIYPLLNQFFKMPSTWNVEDRDFGLIRYVPATNTQMLPLFALQLAFIGFNDSVPGAMWLQYTAGLTPFDYGSRFGFMKQLVLAEAAIIALMAIQGTINLGAKSVQMAVDGMSYKTEYDVRGPFAGLIDMFMKRRDALMKQAIHLVSGPMVNFM